MTNRGASVNLLNQKTFQQVNCKSNISVPLTKNKLKTYFGEIMSGQFQIEFSYECNKIKTTFLITDERSPNVLVKDILRHFQKITVTLKDIFDSLAASEVSSSSDHTTLNKVTSESKVVF